ncbi:arginine--tRNA ligase [Tepidimicrobium xylanilyticum]|uniref:Arginine--tRNA ligase n=1 Tax=Tepidimicrobium xylanilyticum TaxID=1123352 RepID=A0A1H3BH88_9FIRM|nr:arginine--tRNA ligase [Tepidimicrobium xylanilyticum]GMG96902.1 arginine--tRNA ligase [Tepidimicrobium xylanilyticum]SDX41266.1 arginyl-tRNA synthetase [Tepidimicrobium xylanilyticum]
MLDFKKEVVNLVSQVVEGLDHEEIESLIEIPPNYNMGDYAFPCFKLAKIYRKAPNLIAEDLVNKIDGGDNFERIENVGPYINFFINKAKLTEVVLKAIAEEGNRYGSINVGKGRTAIVEFSSPNIAKPFHIGHIRTTVIGNSIEKIFKFQGYNTVRINHLGDYGTQFGMLIAAYKKWGDAEVIEKDPINELLKLYVKFNAEAEKDENLKEEARYWFKELEDGNEEALELWQWIRDISLKEFNKVYKLLNIEFDSYAGESFYSDKMDRVIRELEEKNLLQDSKGAKIVDLEPYGMPPALIKKSDGSTLYITRDIAAAIYRKEHYDFYKNIYVVASQQNLHFKQLIKIIDLMGYDWAYDCVHIPFGMVSLEDGTLSTRQGRVVFLEDVLNKAIESTLKIIEERNPDLENKEEVAKQVGVGAVIFQELFNNRIKDYVFSWERTLSFEGETGPYVQYTHARANSLLEKGDFNLGDEIDFSLLKEEDEINLVRLLYNFPSAVLDALEKYEPSFITRYVVEVAKAFNKFYNSCPILNEEEELKKARLNLVYATKTVIKTALYLLGIEAPNKM